MNATPHSRLSGGLAGLCRVAAAAVILVIAVPSSSIAQVDDIAVLYDKAIKATAEENWKQALEFLNEIVERYGPSAEEDFGARFGGIYYSKGVCHYKLGEWGEAASAFETSHEKFPTKDPENRNPYETLALLHWGAAEQNLGNHQKSIELLNKFRSSNPEKDTYSEAAWYLAMGINYANLGKMSDAERYIGKAFEDASLAATPQQLFQGFKELMENWIEKGRGATDDALAFMAKYGARLRIGPWRMASNSYDIAMLKLGARAVEKRMPAVAIEILSYVPKTKDVVQELKERATQYAVVPERLQAELNKFQQLLEGGDPTEVRTLSQIASAYRSMDNSRAGFVLYDHLAKNYAKSQFRPRILYGAALMASEAGLVRATQHYGLMFLDEYPNHELKKDVSALLLGRLFEAGEYAKALEIAEDLRSSLPSGAPDRDLPDFIIGGALYFLGKYEQAAPELDAHIRTYPESKFRENALYYQASNTSKLMKWEEAATLLDKFIADHPESQLLDLAWFDRASVHFSLDEFSKARQAIEKVQSDYPNSEILDSALLLGGDIYQFEEKLDRAKESYLAAKDLAEQRDNEDVRANALGQLVNVSVMQDDLEAALDYYDQFQAAHSGSLYEPVTVVSAMPALAEADRADEGIAKLEEMIVQLGQSPDSQNLERAVNSYVQFHSDLHGPEATVARLRNFPNVPPNNNALQAWLTIARIDLLEDPANREKFDRREAQIQVAYDDLRKLPKDEMANYILVKVGNNMLDRGDPGAAEEWFTHVLDGEVPDFKDRATLGLGRVYAASEDPQKRNNAVAMFKRVISDYQSSDLQELATLEMGRILYEQGKYREALDDAFLKYMENPSWRSARAEVTYKIGRSYDELKDYEKALYAYTNVIGAYPGQLNLSAPAWYRAAEIQWAKGEKEKAFQLIDQMVERMGALQGHELDRGDHIRQAKNLRDKWAREIAPSGR